MKRWSPILIVALLASACSSSEESQAIEAVRDQNEALGLQNDLYGELEPAEQECLDDAVADLDITAAAADSTSAGVAERAALNNALIDCVDDITQQETYVANLTTTFNAALGRGIDIDTTETQCVLQRIVDESSDPGMALADGSSPEDQAIVLDAFTSCLDESSSAVLLGTGGPQNYGDDPRLDLLYDDCGAGDDRACDLLYSESAIDSEYERFAIDCGGRGGDAEFCTAGLVTVPIAEGDPLLESLLADCGNEDMTACDFLFRVAPSGSAAGQFGFTCGERIPSGGLPDCRTRFADES